VAGRLRRVLRHPTYWPDFDREELLKAIWEYSSRRRRFGMTDEQIDAQDE
jgi:undecaprenyl diphosphate synthase